MKPITGQPGQPAPGNLGTFGGVFVPSVRPSSASSYFYASALWWAAPVENGAVHPRARQRHFRSDIPVSVEQYARTCTAEKKKKKKNMVVY